MTGPSPEPFDLDRELRDLTLFAFENPDALETAAAIRAHVSHLEELVTLKHPNDLRARNEKLAANNNALNARATKAEARVSHLEAENAKFRTVRTSSDLPEEHWIARQLPAGTSLRGYAEERAISVMTRSVLDAISESGVSRAEIARLLGTTKSYVSQILNGSVNMTLKTLGALLWATGRQVSVMITTPTGEPSTDAPVGSHTGAQEPFASQLAPTFQHEDASTVAGTTPRPETPA